MLQNTVLLASFDDMVYNGDTYFAGGVDPYLGTEWMTGGNHAEIEIDGQHVTAMRSLDVKFLIRRKRVIMAGTLLSTS